VEWLLRGAKSPGLRKWPGREVKRAAGLVKELNAALEQFKQSRFDRDRFVLCATIECRELAVVAVDGHLLLELVHQVERRKHGRTGIVILSALSETWNSQAIARRPNCST